MSVVAKPWAGGGKKGVHFWCPGCNDVHSIAYEPEGWTWNGSIEKPTFSPSVLVKKTWGDESVCHSFIREGRVEFLSDCTHALAGQTVNLPPWPYAD